MTLWGFRNGYGTSNIASRDYCWRSAADSLIVRRAVRPASRLASAFDTLWDVIRQVIGNYKSSTVTIISRGAVMADEPVVPQVFLPDQVYSVRSGDLPLQGVKNSKLALTLAVGHCLNVALFVPIAPLYSLGVLCARGAVWIYKKATSKIEVAIKI